jgi:hypothetical protein
LNRSTLNDLYSARQQAVQRQRATVSTWVSRDGTLHGHMQLSQRALNWIIAAAIATLLAINLTYLDRASDHDHSDIDIAILTDDLPVDMFVDQ